MAGLIVVGPGAHLLSNGLQMRLHELQGSLGGNQELHVMPVHIVDVGRAEEAPIQNHLDLLIAQGVHVRQQFPKLIFYMHQASLLQRIRLKVKTKLFYVPQLKILEHLNYKPFAKMPAPRQLDLFLQVQYNNLEISFERFDY